MQSILLSIRPQHVANILNHYKTVEIRKKFPKDYTGWIYIYCTKQGGKYWRRNEILYEDDILIENGKVVARFWCDIEEIKFNGYFSKSIFTTSTMSYKELMFKSCLSRDELIAYFNIPGCFKTSNLQPATCGYAIHISKLEIFNEPKELNEFGCKRAPQNYCYIDEGVVK